MDEPSFTDVDDELFPACNADRVGWMHADEFGVIYICDLVEGLGFGWVQLGKAQWPRPRPRGGRQAARGR